MIQGDNNLACLKRLSFGVLLLACLSVGCYPLEAQDELADGAETQQDRHTRIRQFVDAFMSREMQSMGVPGACVAVVDQGNLVLVRGYGVADSSAGTPVDPVSTCFRIASVGKTFTALAVLQVAASGGIDLDSPVAGYLDSRFSVPKRVTLRRLLLHTAGLDERLIGYQTRREADFPLLGDHLSQWLPSIRFTTDEFPSYSNYGYGLAGYVIESVTGTSLRDWIDARVFRPLAMDHSFYAIPPLDDRIGQLATEYHGSGEIQPMHFSNPYPASGVATSAEDMGKFLQAFMKSYAGGSSVISPDVARQMMNIQLPLIRNHEGLGFGLNQQLISGQAVWMKGGAAPKHSAVVALLPQEQSAIFVALNRQEPRLWELLLSTFVEEFHRGPHPTSLDTTGLDLPPVAGVYELTRTSRSTIEKVAAPLFQVTVRQVDGGSITIESLSDDIPSGPFYHQEGETFRSEQHYASFKGRGRERYLLMNVTGEHFAFRTVPWYATRTLHVSVLCVAAAMILLFPPSRLMLRVKRRFKDGESPPPDARPQLEFVCHVVAATLLLFGGAAIHAIANIQSTVFAEIVPLYMVSGAAALFTIAVIYLSVRCMRAVWTGTEQGTIVYPSLLAASGISLVILFAWYNLLSFRY